MCVSVCINSSYMQYLCLVSTFTTLSFIIYTQSIGSSNWCIHEFYYPALYLVSTILKKTEWNLQFERGYIFYYVFIVPTAVQ